MLVKFCLSVIFMYFHEFHFHKCVLAVEIMNNIADSNLLQFKNLHVDYM